MSSSMAEFDSTWDQVFTNLTGVAEEMFGSHDQLRKVLACCSEEDPEGASRVVLVMNEKGSSGTSISAARLTKCRSLAASMMDSIDRLAVSNFWDPRC